MSMPGIWEFAILAVLALLIFGPEKLPQLARSFARTVSSFRREAQSAVDELKRSADVEGFSEAAGEFKSATRDLRQQMTLSGPSTSPASASDTATARSNTDTDAEQSVSAAPTAAAPDREPAPHDPYAT